MGFNKLLINIKINLNKKKIKKIEKQDYNNLILQNSNHSNKISVIYDKNIK